MWFSWYLPFRDLSVDIFVVGYHAGYNFNNFGKFLAITSSNIFSSPLSLFSSSGTPIIHVLQCLLLSHRYQMPFVFFWCFHIDYVLTCFPVHLFFLLYIQSSDKPIKWIFHAYYHGFHFYISLVALFKNDTTRNRINVEIIRQRL